MGIFNFGDRLPNGPDTDLYVSYSVEGFPGGMLAGPYKDKFHADSERDDIAGYEGVRNARVVTRADLIQAKEPAFVSIHDAGGQ